MHLLDRSLCVSRARLFICVDVSFVCGLYLRIKESLLGENNPLEATAKTTWRVSREKQLKDCTFSSFLMAKEGAQVLGPGPGPCFRSRPHAPLSWTDLIVQRLIASPNIHWRVAFAQGPQTG